MLVIKKCSTLLVVSVTCKQNKEFPLVSVEDGSEASALEQRSDVPMTAGIGI
jgi:hypothetical protein